MAIPTRPEEVSLEALLDPPFEEGFRKPLSTFVRGTEISVMVREFADIDVQGFSGASFDRKEAKNVTVGVERA